MNYETFNIVYDRSMYSGGNVYVTCPNGQLWAWFDSEKQAKQIIESAIETAINALDWGAIASDDVKEYLEMEGLPLEEQAINAICIRAIECLNNPAMVDE